MKTAEDLRRLLERIDHRSYPAYKDTRGAYQFGKYVLSIDHVQGDPFAAPSRLSVKVPGKAAAFPKELYDKKHKRIALQDYLTRNFWRQTEHYSYQAKGSGKSGVISISRCGQEVLEMGLVAFIANGSVLPRESGVSQRPMKGGIPFVSPSSMEVTLDLPNRGRITGMGIRKGVTLIVGGGYHGKSTLLKALETGVYPHIAGDGREYVVTEDTALKIRAEDGRSIKQTDISMFISDLPNGKNTASFETEDASGSTSQAANVVEGLEAGARTFLIDEDTSATNFMVRDELMQRVIHRDMEPITPFIERVRDLYEIFGISTVIVAGSSGAYFEVADQVVQMDRYVPKEITALAKDAAKEYPKLMLPEEKPARPSFERMVRSNPGIRSKGRVKLKTLGRDGVMLNHETIDLRYVEQLVDSEQLTSLGNIVRYLEEELFDGKKTLGQAIEEMNRRLAAQGLDVLSEGGCVAGNLAIPRKQEIYACLNRYRQLRGSGR